MYQVKSIFYYSTSFNTRYWTFSYFMYNECSQWYWLIYGFLSHCWRSNLHNICAIEAKLDVYITQLTIKHDYDIVFTIQQSVYVSEYHMISKQCKPIRGITIYMILSVQYCIHCVSCTEQWFPNNISSYILDKKPKKPLLWWDYQ